MARNKGRSWRDRGSYGGDYLKGADFTEEGDDCRIDDIGDAQFEGGEEKLTAKISGEVDGEFVLNATNCRTLERISESDDPDDWIGLDIVVWNDMSVNFNGKIGAIRIRPVKKRKSARRERDGRSDANGDRAEQRPGREDEIDVDDLA